jgi:hypothetical protein
MYNHDAEDVYTACGVTRELLDETQDKIDKILLNPDIRKTSREVEESIRFIDSVEKVKCLVLGYKACRAEINELTAYKVFAEAILKYAGENQKMNEALQELARKSMKDSISRIFGKKGD